MATSSPSTDATPSSGILASHPAELRSLIARMCRDQDYQYKARTLTRSGTRHVEVAKAGATEWDGQSLNALFLLSRDWKTAAARYIFEVSFVALVFRMFPNESMHRPSRRNAAATPSLSSRSSRPLPSMSNRLSSMRPPTQVSDEVSLLRALSHLPRLRRLTFRHPLGLKRHPLRRSAPARRCPPTSFLQLPSSLSSMSMRHTWPGSYLTTTIRTCTSSRSPSTSTTQIRQPTFECGVPSASSTASKPCRYATRARSRISSSVRSRPSSSSWRAWISPLSRFHCTPRRGGSFAGFRAH